MANRYRRKRKEKIDPVFEINKNEAENVILDKKYNIGLIIPTSSNKKKYKNINDYIFLNNTLPSIINTSSDNHFYNFYLGYDDDDIFFLTNKEKIIDHFNNITKNNYNIKLIEINNLKGKVGAIWSFLAQKAKNENDYIYQIGDDIEFFSYNWDNYFIKKLIDNNNLGCTGPFDISINNSLLTQSFVNIKHLNIFDNYFPPEIINWDIDSWITHLYGGIGDINNKITNKDTGCDVRYKIVSNPENYLKIKEKDLVKLNQYLIKENNFNNLLTTEEENNNENIIISVGIISNKNNTFLLRLINKLLVSSSKYSKDIEIIIDNQEGNKKERIFNKSRGKYITYIREQDLVSDDYFQKILTMIKKDIDILKFYGSCYIKENLIHHFLTGKDTINDVKKYDIDYYNIFKKDKISINNETIRITEDNIKYDTIFSFLYHKYD
jgi:hypothetical protein